jgi:hypothetical protein
LLHELGGHALASVVLACGIDGYKLTFFGHGQVHYAPCTGWTAPVLLTCDWAGLVVTLLAGLVAALGVRKIRSPFRRVLVSILALGFLLGQLSYATSGGYHRLYDPGRLARLLAARGLPWAVWLPSLIAYTAAAVLLARTLLGAFAEHFGARSRRELLARMATTLGPAGLLYLACYRLEWTLRTDLEMRGVAVAAERIAAAQHVAPPFPIERVLIAVALAAFALALARPVADRGAAAGLPAKDVALVAGAAGALLALLVGLDLAAR